MPGPASAACRPGLSRTLAAFGAQWRQQPAFTASLLDSLLADMQRLAGKAAEEAAASAAAADGSSGEAASVPSGSLRQLLALAACVLPLLDAAAAVRLPACQQHLEQLVGICREAVLAAAAGMPAAAPALTAELAGHVARLSALAPAAAAAAASEASPPSGGGAGAEAHQAAGGQHVTDELITGGVERLNMQDPQAALSLAAAESQPIHLKLGCGPQPPAGATAQQANGLQQLFRAVASFATAAASQACVLAQPSAVLALLAAARSWAHMMVQQQQQPAALLPAPGQPGRQSDAGAWLLGLRAYSNKEVVLHTAQLLVLVVQHSPAALEVLLADTVAQAAALDAAEAPSRQPPSSAQLPAAEGPAALLLFNLQLLQAAALQLTDAGLLALWRRLLPLARPGSALAVSASQRQEEQPHRLWLQLLGLLQAAGQHLAAGTEHGTAATDGVALAAAADDALLLLADVLTSGSVAGAAADPILLAALQWLQEAAAWPHNAHIQGTASGSSVAAALRASLGCTALPSAAVRAAALCATRAWVCSGRGCAVLLQDPTLAAALFQAAILHLSDLHPPSAEAAQELLLAAAAPLALSGALATSPNSSSGPAVMPEAAAVALQAQQLGFRPAQLQQWLVYLTGSDGPVAVLTSAGRQQLPSLRQWLPRLLHSMQASAVPAGERSSGASDSTSRLHW